MPHSIISSHVQRAMREYGDDLCAGCGLQRRTAPWMVCQHCHDDLARALKMPQTWTLDSGEGYGVPHMTESFAGG